MKNKARILLAMTVLTASGVAMAHDPLETIGSFNQFTVTDKNTPTSASQESNDPTKGIGSVTGQGFVLTDPDDQKPKREASDAPSGAVPLRRLATGAPINLTGLQCQPLAAPDERDQAVEIKATNGCALVNWVMDDLDPSKLLELIPAVKTCTKNDATPTLEKDMVIFFSRSQEPQYFIYSRASRSFYRYDSDPSKNKKILVEFARPAEAKILEDLGAEKLGIVGPQQREVYRFDNGEVLYVQDLHNFLTVSSKQLDTVEAAKQVYKSQFLPVNVASTSVGCLNSGTWLVARPGYNIERGWWDSHLFSDKIERPGPAAAGYTRPRYANILVSPKLIPK